MLGPVFWPTASGILLILLESAELEYPQKGLSHLTYLPSYILYLYWIRYLHTRNPGCGSAVWCE